MPGYVVIDQRTGKEAWFDGRSVRPVTPEIKRMWDTGFLAGAGSGAPDAMSERQQYVLQAKQLADEAAAYGQIAGKRRADLQSFVKNNIGTNTGGWAENLPFGMGEALARMGPGMPHPKGGGPAADRRANMASLQSEMQLANVPKGQGQITDFERGLIAMGLPEIKKDGITNQNLVHRQIGYLDEQGDRISFKQKYLQVNGHLNGADAAWQSYLQANPYVLDDPATGQVRYRDPKNRQAWDGYFGLRQSAPQRPTMTAKVQAPQPSMMGGRNLPPLTTATAAKYTTPNR